MIKIELIIKENEKVEFKNKIATAINVEIKEEGIKATRGEKEASQFLKKKLALSDETVIDKTKDKEFSEILTLLEKVKDLIK